MRRSRGQQHKLILLSVTQTDPLNLLLLIRAEAFLGSFTSPQTGGGATLKRLPCLWLDRSVYVSGRVFCCFLRRVPLMKLACWASLSCPVNIKVFGLRARASKRRSFRSWANAGSLDLHLVAGDTSQAQTALISTNSSNQSTTSGLRGVRVQPQESASWYPGCANKLLCVKNN